MASTISAGTTSGTALNFAGDTTGTLAIQTGSTPTTAITVDASQNVGIGTSSPSYRFDCQNNQNATVNFRFANTNTVDTNTRTALNVTAGNRNVYLESVNADHNYLNWTAGTNLYFQNGAATIDSSGNLLVGTTTSYGVTTINATATGTYALVLNSPNTSGTYYLQSFRAATTVVGSITSNGSSTSYNTSSDYRLKENIVDLPNALTVISQLKPRQFDWKETKETTTGFIAHELSEVMPQAVTGEKDAVDEKGNPAYQGIDTSFLVATLTAAIQELNAKVDAQAATITALQAKVGN